MLKDSIFYDRVVPLVPVMLEPTFLFVYVTTVSAASGMKLPMVVFPGGEPCYCAADRRDATR
jgi:hypothetical protein